jgi:hypothetical protein
MCQYNISKIPPGTGGMERGLAPRLGHWGALYREPCADASFKVLMKGRFVPVLN